VEQIGETFFATAIEARFGKVSVWVRCNYTVSQQLSNPIDARTFSVAEYLSLYREKDADHFVGMTE
jgi:hypothetical protein